MSAVSETRDLILTGTPDEVADALRALGYTVQKPTSAVEDTPFAPGQIWVSDKALVLTRTIGQIRRSRSQGTVVTYSTAVRTGSASGIAFRDWIIRNRARPQRL